jgi:DNA-binding MarR family transcriptional regulator
VAKARSKAERAKRGGRRAESSPQRLDLETHVAYLLISLSNKISSSASSTYMRHFGIGVTEWRVLAMLAIETGITANRINQVTGVDKAVLSRAIKSLATHGYVAPVGDARDARRSLLSLTETGRALHNRVVVASMARDARLVSGLTAQERRTLVQLLKRLAGNVPFMNAYDPSADEA